jgi:hypothetical protein
LWLYWTCHTNDKLLYMDYRPSEVRSYMDYRPSEYMDSEYSIDLIWPMKSASSAINGFDWVLISCIVCIIHIERICTLRVGNPYIWTCEIWALDWLIHYKSDQWNRLILQFRVFDWMLVFRIVRINQILRICPVKVCNLY